MIAKLAVKDVSIQFSNCRLHIGHPEADSSEKLFYLKLFSVFLISFPVQLIFFPHFSALNRTVRKVSAWNTTVLNVIR